MEDLDIGLYVDLLWQRLKSCVAASTFRIPASHKTYVEKARLQSHVLVSMKIAILIVILTFLIKVVDLLKYNLISSEKSLRPEKIAKVAGA